MSDVTARDIVRKFDLHKSGRGWRGSCPACSYPGTFILKERAGKPSMRCVNCQDRDAIDAAVTGERPAGTYTPADRPKLSPAEATAAAMGIWNGAAAAVGTAAETYLTMRGLSYIANSAALRFRTDCRHPSERGFWSAMVALVVDPAGTPCAVHRTYLRADGSGKAAIELQKASKGPVWGGVIRLDPVASELVVGEGIETAASAGRLLDLPAWSAVFAGNMATGLVLPTEVRSVVIAADPDAPGEKAAVEAALRWKAEGRRVRIARTGQPGRDFNDLLLAQVA